MIQDEPSQHEGPPQADPDLQVTYPGLEFGQPWDTIICCIYAAGLICVVRILCGG